MTIYSISVHFRHRKSKFIKIFSNDVGMIPNSNFGPPVYPMGSMLIALVRPSVSLLVR